MRRNLSNDFEAIYLRFSSVKKYLDNARPGFLDDVEIQKIVKYMTAHYFNKNDAILRASGFDFEDMHNISQFFALAFSGTKYEAKTKHDEILLLSNFLSQRLSRLVTWVVKKFDTNEIVLSSCPLESCASPEPVETSEDDKTLDSLDLVNYRISKAGNDMAKKSALMRQKRELVRWVITKKTEDREKRLATKAALALAKKKLNKNIKKYRNILCYYATVKFVSKDVRKYARLYCRKYGINYIEWAKERIEKGSGLSSCYTF